MASRMKGFKQLNRQKTYNYGLGCAVMFFLVLLTYITMSKTTSMRVTLGNSQAPTVVIRNSSSTTPDDAHGSDRSTENFGGLVDVKTLVKPICDFSNNKSDICEVDGDVRIIGKDVRMLFAVPSYPSQREVGGPWTIKPYARKWDAGSGAQVRPVTLRLVDGYPEGPPCAVNYTAPALLFAIGGWTGNFFHDFVDVLVPLFETAYRFGGEVQLLVANNKPAWVNKYRRFFDKISRYPMVDYDADDRVHCFREATLGLRCVPEDFRIDPARDPYGITMVDFTRFMRSAYDLKRDYPLRLGRQGPGEKPRLLLITRTGTRKFTNVPEIVAAAEGTGYEVLVTEADSDVGKFSAVVNTCDVLVGVHGSGLTNLVFLPTEAVVIQIVPWGKLDWIAGNYFREPSKLMKLHYLEYSINEEETTLKDMYPRDHAVFTDPMSLHPQSAGWDVFFKTFLVQQDVRLDVTRFRPFLEQALDILRQQS